MNYLKELADRFGLSEEQMEIINNKFKKYCEHHSEYTSLLSKSKWTKGQEELHKEANWLIYKYNQLLHDNQIKNKDYVRDWFYEMTQPLINQGIQSFKFLYCESMLPTEALKKLYHISDEDDNKYCKKYSNSYWFDAIKNV